MSHKSTNIKIVEITDFSFNDNKHIIIVNSNLRVEVFYFKLFKSNFKSGVLCTKKDISIRYDSSTIRNYVTWSTMSKKERDSHYIFY
jgi:hypothetical protein